MKVYAKLPGWFKVPTPLGTYNPDWAVLVETDGAERLYFVVETKGGLFKEDLARRKRPRSSAARPTSRPWPVDGNPARFVQATKLDDLLKHC